MLPRSYISGSLVQQSCNSVASNFENCLHRDQELITFYGFLWEVVLYTLTQNAFLKNFQQISVVLSKVTGHSLEKNFFEYHSSRKTDLYQTDISQQSTTTSYGVFWSVNFVATK